MHGIIEELIGTFNAEEYREFKYFLLGRSNVPVERADISLLTRIREHKTLPPSSSNAYHQTRRRLRKHLELFVQNENIRSDTTSQIINHLEVAKYLVRKSLFQTAWHYLQKAEKAAIKSKEFHLLDFIYHNQVHYHLDTWSLNEPPANIPDLLSKREQNSTLASAESDTHAAHALLLHEISEYFSREVFGDIDQIINRILKKYKLTARIYQSPATYCRIVNMVCRSLREKKDYSTLKKYALRSYSTMKQKDMIRLLPPDVFSDLVRSIYLASVRTRDYPTATEFQHIYNLSKAAFTGQHDTLAYIDFRSSLMKADLFMFTGKLKDAKGILLGLSKTYPEPFSSFSYFFLQVNMMAMYFKSAEIKNCLKVHSECMQRYGKKVLKREGLGLEMLLFTEIYGALFHFENKDPDYGIYLLGKIRRKYARLFRSDAIARELLFIKITVKVMRDSSYLQSSAFKTEYKIFTGLKAYIPGDKEYISLSAWLTSKKTGQSYYECFLALVKP